MSGSAGYNRWGVYVFRCRRPGLLGRIPVLGRHTAYVGQSKHVRSRRKTHLEGSFRYNTFPKPWSDLKPTWYFIPLPPGKWLRLTIETLLICLLWPVYNHQKNLWNPRRIPLHIAKRQRDMRNVISWSFNFRYGHAMLWVIGIVMAIQRGWVPW